MNPSISPQTLGLESQIKTASQKKVLLNYMNVFRGFAILTIVLLHTFPFSHSKSFASSLAIEIFAHGSIFFVFISGFLFQFLSSKYEYKNYLSKKWYNVICPYLITSIPGILNVIFLCQPADNPYYEFPKIVQVFLLYATGCYHNVPTWFIPMMAVFFIISPILIYLERKGMLYKTLPVLLLVTLLVQRPTSDSNFLILLSFLHFLSVYVTGMYFAAHREKIEMSNKSLLLLLGLSLSLSALSIYMTMEDSYFRFSSFARLVLSIVFLSLFQRYDGFIQSKKWINKTFDVLAKYSFGIFFIHYYMCMLLDKFIFKKYMILYSGIGINFAMCSIHLLRFVFVVALSVAFLFVVKTLLNKMNIKNTRIFIGV